MGILKFIGELTENTLKKIIKEKNVRDNGYDYLIITINTKKFNDCVRNNFEWIAFYDYSNENKTVALTKIDGIKIYFNMNYKIPYDNINSYYIEVNKKEFTISYNTYFDISFNINRYLHKAKDIDIKIIVKKK